MKLCWIRQQNLCIGILGRYGRSSRSVRGGGGHGFDGWCSLDGLVLALLLI